MALPLLVKGQDTVAFRKGGPHIDKSVYLSHGWKYRAGDDMQWASAEYNDSGWEVRKYSFTQRDNRDTSRPAPISWWRHSIIVDSSAAGKPLMVRPDFYGAMEVYLDGALVRRYGSIEDGGKRVLMDAERQYPLLLVIPTVGSHELAIRYAELAPPVNHLHEEVRQGLGLIISEGNDSLEEFTGNSKLNTGMSLFLFGLFLAFAILHIVLFLYYRAARSNAWFALFSICLATLFMYPCALYADAMGPEHFLDRWIVTIALLACFALSGFINCVFTKRKPWTGILALAAIPFSFINDTVGKELMVGAIVLVSLETIITIVKAIYRKLPGARIIGGGLSLFLLLVLSLFIYIIIRGNSNVGFSGLSGVILLLLSFVGLLCIPISMSAYLAWSFAGISRNLQKHLVEVERLSAEARAHEAERERMQANRQAELEEEVAIRTTELRRQKQQSDDLLLNILPSEVADELKENGKATAKQYERVTVLFTDFVDFTQHSEQLTAGELVAEIHECFSAFDDIITRNGLEKIKTVGDAYIAVSGMPAANADHAVDVVRAGLQIGEFIKERRRTNPQSFGIRIGIHSGAVVAGIVGVKKFAYDIWGDTVNTAARMEQHGEPGKVNISGTTYELVKDTFTCTPRGELEVKHKGRMHMYWVEG